MMTKQEAFKYACNKIDNQIIPNCCWFKIGKTGDAPKDRFNQPDYAGCKGLTLLCSSDSSTISELEKALINRYINNHLCGNIKGGNASLGDNMTSEYDKYHVYVVWKENRNFLRNR